MMRNVHDILDDINDCVYEIQTSSYMEFADRSYDVEDVRKYLHKIELYTKEMKDMFDGNFGT